MAAVALLALSLGTQSGRRGGGSSVTPGYLSEGGLKLNGVFFDNFSSLNKEMLEMQNFKGGEFV